MNAELKKYIGGSDIAALMGASPYASAYDVWLRITGRHETEDSSVMKRGRRFESVVRQIATEDLGLAVGESAIKTAVYDGLPVRASADGIINKADGSIEIFEAKTGNEFTRHLWGSEPPLHYALQCQWYMMAFAAPRAHLVALIGLDDVRHYVIEADIGLQRRMVQVAQEFHVRHVLGDVAPPMSGSSNTADYLEAKHPAAKGEVIEANEELETAIDELLDVRRDIKDLEAREERLKNHVKQAIGDNRGIKSPYATITWAANAPREVVDWKAIAEELQPDGNLINKHTSIKSSSRVFRITERSA
jgi:putative phage-type endonuclease